MDLKITKHFMTGVSLVKGGLALIYIFINVPTFLSFIYFSSFTIRKPTTRQEEQKQWRGKDNQQSEKYDIPTYDSEWSNLADDGWAQMGAMKVNVT